jgi:hypothetical protein
LTEAAGGKRGYKAMPHRRLEVFGEVLSRKKVPPSHAQKISFLEEHPPSRAVTRGGEEAKGSPFQEVILDSSARRKGQVRAGIGWAGRIGRRSIYCEVAALRVTELEGVAAVILKSSTQEH